MEGVYQRYGRKGSYAVVTGASDGIGLAYARTLASLGFNIFLVSRNKERLEAARSLVRAENKAVQVDILVQDLG